MMRPVEGQSAGIEWGYARVSTRKQDLHRQVHALTSYGIPDGLTGDAQRLYVDKLTGTNFNRLDWAKLRPRMRAGDVLNLSELDRLGRSQTEMIQLFNELTATGIHVNVLGGPIPFDTRNPGPATEMAKAILIFLGQVELIYKNERVASARESGKTAHRPRTLAPQVEDNLAGDFRAGTPVDELVTKYGVSRATVYRIAREHNVKNDPRRTPAPTGRGKSLTPGQIATAQRLRADGLSVRQIADAVGSSRGTVHRVLTSTTAPLELSAAVAISGTAAEALPMPASPRVAACPTCGHRPSNKHELQLHREGLETVWLLPDPAHPATAVVERWHCERCQPHQAGIVMCGLCSSTVMLGDELAASDQEPIPDAAVLWLAGHGWSEADGQWTCGTHRPRSATA